jgi:UDP:flavonoid glycosyltransferase YjiC (YdhE family)
MARILVASMPFAGHVGVLAPIATELSRRGHEIIAYTGAKYQGRFTASEQAGATWLPWSAAPDFDDADPAATIPQVGDGKGLRGGRANVEHLLFGTGAAQAEDILAEAARKPFDLLVTDYLSFGGALAGEKLGMPWASVAVTPLSLATKSLPPPGLPVSPAQGALGRGRDVLLHKIFRATTRRFVDPVLNQMRSAAGLAPASGGMDSLFSPHLILAHGVSSLDYSREDLPSHAHFIGRVAAASGGALPYWWPELAEARTTGRPIVYVTQGTLDVDPDDLLKPAIAGLAGEDVLVICTTARPGTGALGALPGNVRVAEFLPHDLLLPMIDVMVTNGGWGGVLAALQAGVPLVVAGDSLDKPEGARRVAWSGAGINLRTGSPSAAKVRRAVLDVLAQPARKLRAREIGEQLTAAGGTGTAAKLIEGLSLP